MSPDEVLRKGSGTLCESLLMVKARSGNIICPNKHVDGVEKMHRNHLLESETYIGGHVECLQSGVFRADLKVKFALDATAYQEVARSTFLARFSLSFLSTHSSSSSFSTNSMPC